ncbi:MAG: hypothetical protein HY763_03190 [Planctomycetes bacterium]|nr:hypothetical protein [Planctomycetota bacterium]
MSKTPGTPDAPPRMNAATDAPRPGEASRQSDWRYTWLIVLAGAALLLPGVFWGLPVGKAIAGADRVLRGEVPYRDFWSMYAPGQFYAIAAIFRLFGRHLILQAAAVVFIYALSGGAIFALLRNVGVAPGAAAVVAIVWIAGNWGTAPELTTYPPAILLLVLAVGRIVALAHDARPRQAWTAGALLGAAAIFKHDVAAYGALAATLAILALTRSSPDERLAGSGWAALLRAAGGALIVLAPAAAYIAYHAGAYAWTDLFVFPAGDFRLVRGEAYPSLLPGLTPLRDWLAAPRDIFRARRALDYVSTWILSTLPQFVFVLGVAVTWHARRRLARPALAAAVTSLGLMPCFYLAAHVQKNTHLYSMALLSFCLGAMAWTGLRSRQLGEGERNDAAAGTPAAPPRPSPSTRRVLRGLLILAAAVYAIGLFIPAGMEAYRMVSGWSERRRLDLPGTAGIFVSRRDYETYRPVATFIRRHVPPEEPIFVGVMRHDAIVVNDLRPYYLTGRRNCCRYDELHPGIVDRDEVQQEIIDSLVAERVRCAVLWQFGWPRQRLDEIKAGRRAAIPELGAERLDRFLAARHEVLEQHGELVVLWRKSVPRVD